MSNSAPLNWGAILHSIQSTPKHRSDAKANKERSGEVLIRVEVPELRAIQEQADAFKDNRSDFPDGLQYKCSARLVMNDIVKVDCTLSDPEDYKLHLLKLRNERNFYWGEVQRTGEQKKRRVKRPVKGEPLHELVIMHTPWQMMFLKTQATADIRLLLDKEFRALMSEHHRLSGRDPAGGTIHFDSGILHHNLHSARVSGDNRLVGHARMNTAGPWAVGASRQKELGCVLTEQAADRLARSMARHKERMKNKGREGDPLDVALSRKMDDVFEEWVRSKGLVSEYERCKADYKQWHEAKKDTRKWKKDIQRLPLIAAETCVCLLYNALIPLEVRKIISAILSIETIVDDLLDKDSKGRVFFDLLRSASGGGSGLREIGKALPQL